MTRTTTWDAWTFDWEVTDRIRWPALRGRVVVLVPWLGSAELTHHAAFGIAHDVVFGSTKAAMVTRLDCVSWPEPKSG